MAKTQRTNPVPENDWARNRMETKTHQEAIMKLRKKKKMLKEMEKEKATASKTSANLEETQ